MTLHAWASRWGIGPDALLDLQIRLGDVTPPLPTEAPSHGRSEAYVQSAVRLAAARAGVKAFRNNSGVMMNENGQPVRFGLGNESHAINQAFKSSDLIGWRPVLVAPAMVGTRLAQFWCREVKAPGWRLTPGDARAQAQKRWIEAVNADGGDAAFVTDPEKIV